MGQSEVAGKTIGAEERIYRWGELTALLPVFRKGGTVTAGGSSTLNDGASPVLVIVSGNEPAIVMGLSPIPKQI